MRVLSINSFNIGSTGHIMTDLAEQSRANGIDAYVACPKARDNQKRIVSNQIFIGGRVSRNIHIKLAYITGLHGFFSFFPTLLFIKRINSIKPDIIHLHNLHDSFINIPILFRYINKHNIPVVWTLHDCWTFTGQCPHFSMIKCEKWRTGCYDCPQLNLYPISIIDSSRINWGLKKKWFTKAKKMIIVTPSNWLNSIVKESFLREYPIKTIYNGIDLSVFQPTKSDFRNRIGCGNSFIILGVSFSWGKRKGLDVFIHLSEVLDERFKIVLVGVTKEMSELLPHNIFTIERTLDQRELAEIYTASDLLINPTREEVLGLVNIEALACGTPVLAFNSGGCSECVDATCGSIVETDDFDSLVNEIQRIYKTRPFTHEECIKRAGLFDKRKQYKEYIDLYRSLHD